MSVPDRATFENLYAGKAPWDIGKPQRTIAAVADRVTGAVLDAGCGTGEHALFFAARGHQVTGIDFVEEALRRARVKAAERGLAVEFLVNGGDMVMIAHHLDVADATFDAITTCCRAI